MHLITQMYLPNDYLLPLSKKFSTGLWPGRQAALLYAKACHQARKNNSESSRLQKDPAYKEKRRQQKREMV